jgi:putative flippase GtrA
LIYNNIDGLSDVAAEFREVPSTPLSEVLTFYLPIFFTFRYLSSQDHEKIARILKFWCVLSLAYIIQFVLAFILAEYLPAHAAT